MFQISALLQCCVHPFLLPVTVYICFIKNDFVVANIGLAAQMSFKISVGCNPDILNTWVHIHSKQNKLLFSLNRRLFSFLYIYQYTLNLFIMSRHEWLEEHTRTRQLCVLSTNGCPVHPVILSADTAVGRKGGLASAINFWRQQRV